MMALEVECKLQLPLGSECVTTRSGRGSEFSVTDLVDDDWDQGDKSSYTNLTNDTVFQDIRDHVELSIRRGSFSTIHSEGSKNDTVEGEDYGTKTSDDFTSVPYGLQPRAAYEHNKKNTDIIGISYNGRMRQFIILDAKGITIWKKDLLERNVDRALLYPKFEYRLITNLVYAKKHNVYFALGKDFSLKVLNRDFDETCRVDSDLRSVLFMIFNPVRDELITGGVGGTKIWRYHQVAGKTWTEIKPMANYRLQLKYELPNVGGSWVKKVELDLVQQHLYCCSDTDLFAYTMDGKEIFRFQRAHNMSITGCVFSMESNLLVTASVDAEVKAWSLGGGLVHTFRGHSRAVSSLMLHPDTSSIVLTSSLDGSVRIWSLNTMESLYSLVVSSDGVLWMGITDDRLLYLSTMRAITVWSLNRTATFWAATRSQVLSLQRVSGNDKSTRMLTASQDNSLRIFCMKTQKNLSTVLPPPTLSPLESMVDKTYNRIVNIIYVLINTREIWLYTVRTDPACLVNVWNTLEIQEQINRDEQTAKAEATASRKKMSISVMNKRSPNHRATQYGQGSELVCECLCVCYLNAYVMMYTDEGPCTPIQDNYLLMGLEDGRILFMDPVVRAKKYFQFRASKEGIVSMKYDREHSCLWTQCDLNDAIIIQIWLLPQLELRHEVYCPPDLTGCVRLETSFITSHTNGAVLHHVLQDIDDMGQSIYRPRFTTNDDVSESSYADVGKTDHSGPVCAIDACHKLGIFCTASSDGMVKIWEKKKVLLTEITLDKSLSSAAFLNNCGDLIIGFKNHIFFIEHNKVCPSIKSEILPDEDYAESEIHEDPAILHEGVHEDPDPLDLTNYLVPFNIDFSQDFLEGRRKTEPVVDEPEDDLSDDTSSVLSAAPTAIYQSESSTPRDLALIDLTLSSHVTDLDLKECMKLMLHERGARKHKTSVRFDDSEDDDISAEFKYEMPRFGISPGPSPIPSTPSTMATPSDFDVSSGGESTPVDTEDEDDEKSSFKPIHTPPETTPAVKVITPKPTMAQSADTAPPAASRLNTIRIDSKTLIKRSQKTTEKPKPTEPEAKTEAVQKPKPPPREVKRKAVSSNRRRPQMRASVTKQVSGHADDDEDSVSKMPRARAAKSGHGSPVKKHSRPSAARPRERKPSTATSKYSETAKQKPDIVQKVKPLTDQKPEKAVKPTVQPEPKPVKLSTIDVPEIRTKSPEDRSATSLSQLKVGFRDDLMSESSDADYRDKSRSSSTLRDVLSSPTDGIQSSGTGGSYSGTDSHTGGSQSGTDSHLLRPDTAEKPGRDVTFDGRGSGSHMRESQPQGTEAQSRGISARSRSSHGRAASPTMTIISDYGSDWTVLPPEEEIHVDDPRHDGKSGDIPGWYRATMSAASCRRRYAQNIEPRTSRPHTAVELPSNREELEKMYLAALDQYETEGHHDPLYKNDGTQFDNYHDTLIERHQLLRMQKELRLKSAEARRQQMSLLQQERNDIILRRSASSSRRAKSEPESAIQPHDRSDSTSPCHVPVVPMVRISTRTPDNRNQSAPPGNQSASYHGNQYCSLHKERSGVESPLGGRPLTGMSQGSMSPRGAQRALKSQLGYERPFRSRLNPQNTSVQSPKVSLDMEKVDIRLLDPRNPAALKYPSSKSIPSKCTRYVLIANTRDSMDKIIPTPLEEQLIVERFPQKMDRWLTGYPRSPRTCHGFPSSYLKALAMDRSATVMQDYIMTTNNMG